MADEGDSELVELTGQVFRSRRRRFRTILFFDLVEGRDPKAASPHAQLAACVDPRAREQLVQQLLKEEQRSVACTVKAGMGFSEDDVQHMRGALHCGDQVAVLGHVESRREDGSIEKVLCSSVEVKLRWSACHAAGELFLWPTLPCNLPAASSHPSESQSDRIALEGRGDGGDGEAGDGMDDRRLDDIRGWASGVCKQWINTGRCGMASCHRSHILPQGWTLGRARQEWIRLRLEKRSNGGGKAEPKCQRASVFCSWLEATFGKETLSRGILDVAGGKGDVSFELSVKNGYRSIVVDPRPVKLSKPQFKHFKREAKRRRKAAVLKGLPPPPKEEVRGVEQLQCLFDEPFLERHGPLIEELGLVVGMHPDEATEPLVDHALLAGEPFAVVPCCVFAAQNPQRRLQDGSPVHSYEQFVAYLKEKAPGRILSETLPFAGRNLVLYTPPQASQNHHQINHSEMASSGPFGLCFLASAGVASAKAHARPPARATPIPY